MDTRRNTALFFAAYFLEGLCFYAPVATLYRQAAGLTLAQIGALESVSVVLMLLLELPWGRAADRLGHRRVIALCTALFALSKLVFWRADGFGDFLLERIILAVALSGLSGCDAAYLYACGHGEESRRRFGLWGAVQTAGLVTAGVCSSLFFGADYRSAAGWTAAAYALAAILTLFLTDPPGTPPPAEERPPLRSAVRWSLAHAPLLAGAALFAETVQFVAVFLSQLQYRRAGIPLRWFGLLYVLTALAALAGARSHRLTGWLGDRRSAGVLLGGGAALCLLLALLPLPLPSVLGIMGLRAALALFEPVSLDLQSRAAPPGGAAAQLSCNAMVMELTAAVLNPALGAAADRGAGWALLAGAAACGGGLFLFLHGLRRLA